MKISGIYVIRNLINNKIYIGSAINLNNRWFSHRNKLNNNNHVNRHLQSSFNKYGIDNFIFEVLEYVLDKSYLINREQNWIDFFNPEYNIRKVAENNMGLRWCLSEEIKQKARDRNMIPWNKGKKGVSDETSIKMKLAWEKRRENGTDTPPMLNKKHSAETIEKMKGNKNAEGRIVSDETREKISSSNKGKKHSVESKEKMSLSHKGKKRSDKTKEKIRLTMLNKKYNIEVKE